MLHTYFCCLTLPCVFALQTDVSLLLPRKVMYSENTVPLSKVNIRVQVRTYLLVIVMCCVNYPYFVSSCAEPEKLLNFS